MFWDVEIHKMAKSIWTPLSNEQVWYSSHFNEDKCKCSTLKWNIMCFQFCFNSDGLFSILAGQWPFAQSNALLFQVLKNVNGIHKSTTHIQYLWDGLGKQTVIQNVLLDVIIAWPSWFSCEASPCNSVPSQKSGVLLLLQKEWLMSYFWKWTVVKHQIIIYPKGIYVFMQTRTVLLEKKWALPT